VSSSLLRPGPLLAVFAMRRRFEGWRQAQQWQGLIIPRLDGRDGD